MGKFACYCGYIISDSVYPCSEAGELKWETEFEDQSQEIRKDVKSFFESLESDQTKSWIQEYFGDEYAKIYPDNLNIAEVIDDIYSKVSNKQGHSVYQCPKCERLYLQKEFYTDDWICFEKREN